MAALVDRRKKQWEKVRDQFLTNTSPAIRALTANYLTYVVNQVLNPVASSDSSHRQWTPPYLKNGRLMLGSDSFRTWTGPPEVSSDGLSIRLFLQNESRPEGYTTMLKISLESGVMSIDDTFESEY